MNLSIDDDEPLPYPSGDTELEEIPRRPERMSLAEGALIWAIAGCAIAMLVWVVYGIGLAAYNIGRFLWRVL